MPRATTSISSGKRGGKRDNRPLARTAASVRAAALAASTSAQETVSAPVAAVKLEPAPLVLRIPAASSSASALLSKPNWRHPDELPYIRTPGRAREWDDLAIVRFLLTHAFSVGPKPASTQDPFVTVRTADGADVVLPRGYRIPLLWVSKYQWSSVELVLTAYDGIRELEWLAAKWEILHIARLCATLLDAARAQMGEQGAMERGWRCATFDRALRRYYNDWLIMRDEFVRDFWREFGEEEFEGDVLKLPWARWVLKGHKGFVLSPEDVANGISAHQFTGGLVIDEERGTFEWHEPGSLSKNAPAAVIQPPTPAKPTLGIQAPTPVEIDISIMPQQKPVVRIPLPGEGRRAVKTEPIEILSSAPRKQPPDASEIHAQMRTAYPSPPGETPTAPLPHQIPRAILPPTPITTTMGSLAPGRGRGAHSILQESESSSSSLPPAPRSATPPLVHGPGISEKEPQPAVKRETHSPLDMNLDMEVDRILGSSAAPFTIDIDAEDPDLDVELGYPDEDDPPSASGLAAADGKVNPHEEERYQDSDEDTPSTSRSGSPLPSLSTAQFPVVAGAGLATASASDSLLQSSALDMEPVGSMTRLLVPVDVAGQPILTSSSSILDSTSASAVPPTFADPALAQRFMYEWDALRAEVGELRAEVGALKAQIVASAFSPSPSASTFNHAQLQIEAYPNGASPSVVPSDATSLSSTATDNAMWVHPLSHLFSFSASDGDVDMEVDIAEEGDVSAAPLSASANLAGPAPGSSNAWATGANSTGANSTGANSAGQNASEPLPPRSRKFKVY